MIFKCPLLVVDDILKAKAFYEDVMGQKVLFDFGANITFDSGISLQSKESWLAFIEKPVDALLFGTNNSELYFEEEDFEAFLCKLHAIENIEYVHNVKQFSWGQRVIRFYDPDKHMIEVGESMETVVKRFLKQGFSVEETAEKTQHPIEFIRQCL